MPDFTFSETTTIDFATNMFVNVPIILQYEDTPLIEVVQAETVGRTTQFPIYHPDGTLLAQLKGARLFLTPEGEKAGLVVRHPPDMTVCEMNGKEIIELKRIGAAAIATQAELYTPNGAFVKCRNFEPPIEFSPVAGESLRVGAISILYSSFTGCDIGVLVKADGSVTVCAKQEYIITES